MAIVYKEEFETKLQERLSEKTLWKEICDVKYKDDRTLHNPYLTDSVVGTGTRGTAYTSTAVATVDDTITINNYKYSAQHIDRADLAQKTFSDWMEIADNMGTMLNEALDTAMLAEHAQLTDFGNLQLLGSGLATDPITVSATNVDDIVAAVKREIRKAGGSETMARNKAFIIWRETDFEKVELLASSQGYKTSDDVLKNGIVGGFEYMGVYHYSTSRNVAGHIMAGVKNLFTCGIVKSTYGLMTEIENPVVGGGQISGLGLETRVDYAFKAWAKTKPVLFDVNVA